MHAPYSLQALDARRSVPSKQLGAPGPDEDSLLRMLTSAVRVPDHGKLVPFRFLRISGEARAALGIFLPSAPWPPTRWHRRQPLPRNADASATRRW